MTIDFKGTASKVVGREKKMKDRLLIISKRNGTNQVLSSCIDGPRNKERRMMSINVANDNWI